MKKICYWAPCLDKVGTYKAVVNSALSLSKYSKNYDENILSEYMKNESIEITIDLSIGSKKFTAYTMDLSKEYIEINSDYRS